MTALARASINIKRQTRPLVKESRNIRMETFSFRQVVLENLRTMGVSKRMAKLTVAHLS
jgi:hypothetical protein